MISSIILHQKIRIKCSYLYHKYMLCIYIFISIMEFFTFPLSSSFTLFHQSYIAGREYKKKVTLIKVCERNKIKLLS